MRRREHAPVDAQIKVLRKYATNNGFDIAREFTDEPAKQGYCESFAEMINFLHAQRDIRNVIVEQPNRLFRKMKEWAEFDELIDRGTSKNLRFFRFFY